MDERRGDQPAPETGHPPIVAAVRLSPVQEAWGSYVGHATRCHICRDIDRGRCEMGETLWRTWEELSDAAYRRLTGETQ